ncbi:hypothetical protein MANES_13G075042v8 [Manihot esculenta]|uniref:Uncharacterized protein n=1 Tax=Manihot esculenta TaxID=3983 RepID=A0ACB7GK80_MANES|nr:hypothetical protein MANES_13G075042v8 [Manihot esculenta]
MMRFWSIASKPANVGSVSCGSSPEMSEAGSRSGRGRRRFNSANGNLSKEKVDAVVTLPLLPETPDCKDTPERETLVELLSPKQVESVSTCLSLCIRYGLKK